MADEDSRDPKEPKLTDALKKLFAAGVSGAVLSEEMIRSYVSDLKLPKEILAMVLQNAQKSKDEITNRVSNEVIKIFNKIDWVSEASKFVEGHKFKIEIEVVKKEKDSDK